MLVITFDDYNPVLCGYDTGKNSTAPFFFQRNANKNKIGVEANLPDYRNSTLLSICRTKVINDSPKNFDFLKDNPKDKTCLEKFIRLLCPYSNFENFNKRLKDLQDNVLAQEIVATVRNGAFFKEWADHYKQKFKQLLEFIV